MAVALVALTACGQPDDTDDDSTAFAPPIERGVYGTVPGARQGVPSFVLLQPDPRMPGDPELDEKTIDQFGLQFSPTAVMLRVGGTLQFTNSESALVHNVEVRSVERDSTVFTDDAASGKALQVVLEEEGGYDISCEYHPGMTAFVYVTTAWHGGPADADGSFAFEVPPGEYTLSVWSVDPALRSEQTVTVGPGATEVSIGGG